MLVEQLVHRRPTPMLGPMPGRGASGQLTSSIACRRLLGQGGCLVVGEVEGQ